MAAAALRKGYLVFYNAVQLAGWSCLLCLVTPRLLDLVATGKRSSATYDSCNSMLRFFQLLGYLEVVHNVAGLVNSNPFLTFVQICSRVGLVVVTHAFPAVRSHPAYTTMLSAWSVAEVTRYAFYLLGLLNAKPAVVTWMRYSLFVVLYPLGVVSELAILYSSLSVAKHSGGKLSIAMPNRWNFTFNFYYVLIVAMAMYAPIFPILYGHMLKQRKKVIGGRQDGHSEKKKNE